MKVALNIFLWLVAAALIFTSCSPAARVIKAQQKFDEVGEAWSKLHPCNDTATKYIMGKTDSIPYAVSVSDTTGLQDRLNELAKRLHDKYVVDKDDCSRQISEAYNVGYKQAKFELGKIKIPAPRVDTIVKTSTRDYTVVAKELGESLEANRRLQVEVAQAQTATANYKGKAQTRLWMLIGLLVALVVAGYFLVKKKKVDNILNKV